MRVPTASAFLMLLLLVCVFGPGYCPGVRAQRLHVPGYNIDLGSGVDPSVARALIRRSLVKPASGMAASVYVEPGPAGLSNLFRDCALDGIVVRAAIAQPAPLGMVGDDLDTDADGRVSFRSARVEAILSFSGNALLKALAPTKLSAREAVAPREAATANIRAEVVDGSALRVTFTDVKNGIRSDLFPGIDAIATVTPTGKPNEVRVEISTERFPTIEVFGIPKGGGGRLVPLGRVDEAAGVTAPRHLIGSGVSLGFKGTFTM